MEYLEKEEHIEQLKQRCIARSLHRSGQPRFGHNDAANRNFFSIEGWMLRMKQSVGRVKEVDKKKS